MAPTGFKIADAYVDVEVNQADIDAGIAEVMAKLKAMRTKGIDLGFDMTEFNRQYLEIKAMLATLRARSVDIDTSLNQAELVAAVAEIEAALKALQDEYNIRVDTSGVTEAFAQVIAGATAARASMTLLNDTASDGPRVFHLFGTGIGFTLMQLHWLVTGTSEFLAVALPGTVALGAGLADMAEGATWAFDRLQAVYETGEAMGPLFDKTAGQLMGLPGLLQRAQTAADPEVYELLGAALNTLKDSFHGVFQEGLGVVALFDKFGAEIDLQLQAIGPGIEGLLGKGVSDFTEFGQILGNIGHAILNLAMYMPGWAEVLLKIIDIISRFIYILTTIPHWIITVGMAIEETWRWGGLFSGWIGAAITGLGNLIGKLGGAVYALGDMIPAADGAGVALVGIGASMGSLGEFMSGPWGWVIIGAVAGLVILSLWLGNTKTAAQQLVDSMNALISKSNFAQGFTSAIKDLAPLSQQIALYSRAIASVDFSKITAQVGQQGSTFLGTTGQILNAKSAVSVYQQELNKLVTAIVDTMGMSTKFDGTTFTLTQTIGLATAAGLNLNTAFNKQGQLTALAAQQINNLVTGYKAMDQTGGVLYEDINAINVQTLTQQTDVSKLNSAWDSYIQTITGGTDSLGTFYDTLQTIGNVTVTATSKITALSQGSQGLSLSIGQIAKALTSFSGTSAQVWQNFDTAITNARTVMDWLNTAAAQGVVNQGQLSTAMKGVVAQLLPFAAKSKTAQAELLGLASEGDGGITTFTGLTKWVGNTKDATAGLNGVINTATQGMSNLNQIATNLSTTLNDTVTQAIANGAVNIKGIADATQGFTQSLLENGAQSVITKQKLYDLAGQLYTSGVSATNAKSIITQLGTQEGITGSQAKTLGTEVYNMIEELDKVPRKELTTINVAGQGSWTILPGMSGTTAQGLANAASGGIVPGYAPGKDSVLTLLSPGEAVLVPEAVRKIGAGRIIEWNRIASAGRRTDVGIGGGLATTSQKRLLMAGKSSGLHAHGLADGGVIGSYNGTPQGVGSWANSEVAATTKAIESSVASAVTGFVTQTLSSAGGAVSGNVASWILTALQLAHAPSSWLGILSTLVSKESGGNPNAIDPISVGGQHAEGLWQMLPSTFGMYTIGGSIWNPIMEGAAAIRYIIATYGNPYNIHGLTSGQYIGYAGGGTIPMGGTGIVGENGMEYATATPSGTRITPAPGGGRQVCVTQNFYGTQMPTIEQKAQMKLDLAIQLAVAP
jgi:acetolactate synthase small subunit